MQSARYATVALAFEIYGIPDPPAVRPAARGYLDGLRQGSRQRPLAGEG
jgi:hypothetical protein